MRIVVQVTYIRPMGHRQADSNIANKLRRAWVDSGLTQVSLSEKVGIDQGHLSNILNARRNPSLQTLVKLCRALDVSMDEVVS